MKIRQGMQDTAYAILFIAVGVVIYIAQHNCVKYGYDAAADLYGQAKIWTKTHMVDTKNS